MHVCTCIYVYSQCPARSTVKCVAGCQGQEASVIGRGVLRRRQWHAGREAILLHYLPVPHREAQHADFPQQAPSAVASEQVQVPVLPVLRVCHAPPSPAPEVAREQRGGPRRGGDGGAVMHQRGVVDASPG